MGTSWLNNSSNVQTYEQEKAFVTKEYSFGQNVVLQASKVGSVWYLAVQNNEKNIVWAGVCLVYRNNGDFGWKAMDETVLPYYFDAPASLLKKLTPTDHETSNKWRQTCFELIQEKKASKKANPIANGDRFNVEGLFGKYQGKSINIMQAVDIANRAFHCPDVGVTFKLKIKQVQEIASRKIESVA